MKFISFTSGSCGNCCWIGLDSGKGILMDAGASMRRVRKDMQENGLDLDSVEAVLVTHEHLDHIRFLGTFCKYRRVKVCAPGKLHSALSSHRFTKDHIASCRNILPENEWTAIGDFQVRWFNVVHDAVQTVGYAIRAEGKMLVFMTDLKSVPDEAMALAKEADTVVIESNYDYDMLLNGPYDPQLKRRILEEGHLSNEDCASAIKEFWHPELKNIFLCHLSANNNVPSKAYASALSALEDIGVEKGSIQLRVLDRGKCGPLLNI